MKGRATSFDIAYKAGVSQSTVSRALRNSPLVNAQTRKKVQDIARELKYTVDKNASSLRTQHSETLALLLFEDPSDDGSAINPFFLSMLGSITRACSNKGYDLLVSFQQASKDWHADFEDSKKADGLILLGYGDYVDFEEKLIQLTEQGTHFVRWGAQDNNVHFCTIGSDNFLGGKLASDYLLKQGRKKIAFLGSASSNAPEFLARYNGHCQALVNADISLDPRYQIDALYTKGAGYNAALELLSTKLPFDAVFAACDVIAMGAMQAFKENGLRVPEDIAVIGFDDIGPAQYTTPPLTTMRQDTQLAGELLVNSILETIRGETISAKLIAPQLIVRGSC